MIGRLHLLSIRLTRTRLFELPKLLALKELNDREYILCLLHILVQLKARSMVMFRACLCTMYNDKNE
jgi:hypothetical protein